MNHFSSIGRYTLRVLRFYLVYGVAEKESIYCFFSKIYGKEARIDVTKNYQVWCRWVRANLLTLFYKKMEKRHRMTQQKLSVSSWKCKKLFWISRHRWLTGQFCRQILSRICYGHFFAHSAWTFEQSLAVCPDWVIFRVIWHQFF